MKKCRCTGGARSPSQQRPESPGGGGWGWHLPQPLGATAQPAGTAPATGALQSEKGIKHAVIDSFQLF